MGMRKRYANKKNNPLTHSFSYGKEKNKQTTNQTVSTV
jgi:hypothetical protein